MTSRMNRARAHSAAAKYPRRKKLSRRKWRIKYIYGPLLVVGALLGRIFSDLLVLWFSFDPGFAVNFVILGMAAFFTAVTRAPRWQSLGRVVADGLDNSEPHELAGPESVEDLLLLLLMESDTPRHPAH